MSLALTFPSELDAVLVECEQARLNWQTKLNKDEDYQKWLNILFYALDRKLKCITLTHTGTLSMHDIQDILKTFLQCAGNRVTISRMETTYRPKIHLYGLKLQFTFL
jgi:hypothetical protein